MTFSRNKRSGRSADEGLRYDQVVADCSKILLIGTNSGQALGLALEYLRLACDVTRITVFENVAGGRDEQSFRCVQEAIEPAAGADTYLRSCTYTGGLERWAQLLSTGQWVGGSIESLPECERAVLSSCGIRSILALPVRVQSRWYGFMAFESHGSQRGWSHADIELLRTTTEMVGAQIGRVKTEEELRNRNVQMSELLRRERHASMQLEAAMNQLLAQQEELRIFNQDLRESRVAAEAASQAKSEFLSNMSHEIRTPLTAILGWAEMLNSAGAEGDWPEESVQAVHTIQRNGEHLLEVINGILDLSKIEAGKFKLDLTRCSPRAVVEDVAALMQVRTKAKGLSFVTEFEGPIPSTIRTDPTRLRQVLINLVGNAIKFTETGGVRVVSRLLADSGGAEPVIQFEVIDTGIGMTVEQMSRLFQAFSQVDNSTTRPYQGTGLGLAISKRLTELMGGRIMVESEPGRGSTFRVTVSAGPAAQFDIEARPDARFIEASAASASTGALVVAAADEPLHIRVLLAEDGPDNQRLIAFMLRKVGAEVSVAANGRLAVESVREALACGSPFDIILMDMQMPEMDGYAASSLLRREGVDVPIIALTAHAMSGDCEKCLAAGCSDYLTKPISRARLIGAIRKGLASPVHCTPLVDHGQ